MKRFKKILCVIEPNTHSEAAVIQALKIADDHQAVVTFVSVLEKVGAWHKFFDTDVNASKSLQNYAELKRIEVNAWLKGLNSKFTDNITIYSGIGFIETVKDVIKNDYDLVVKCAEGVDWLDRLFGSSDMHLLRKCPCPVLMLKPSQKNIFHNVIATLDVNNEYNDPIGQCVQDELNHSVLNYSATFSLSELTELHICSVWNAFGESHLRHSMFANTPESEVNRYVDEIRKECSSKLDKLMDDASKEMSKDIVDYLRPKVHLVKGNASKDIPLVATSLKADLIVMGTVARTGLPGLIIGNTAETILEQVTCSVLAIKPKGFISPVTLN